MSKIDIAVGSQSRLDICGALNHIALIFAHLGDSVTALEVCSRHIRWAAGISREHPEALSYVFQPWINQGRIFAFSGETERAIDRFAVRDQLVENGSCTLADVCEVTIDDLNLALASDRVLSQTLGLIQVVDSLKALFYRRHWPEAEEFALLRLDKDPIMSEQLFLSEALIICAMEREMWQSALNMCRSFEHDLGRASFDSVVAALHRVDVHECMGLDVGRVLRSVARKLRLGAAGGSHAVSLIRMQVFLAHLLLRQGVVETAGEVLGQALELTNLLDDEVLRFEIASMLIHGEVPGIDVLSSDEFTRSDYRVIRHKLGLGPVDWQSISCYVTLFDKTEHGNLS